jgi:hypothetical protein
MTRKEWRRLVIEARFNAGFQWRTFLAFGRMGVPEEELRFPDGFARLAYAIGSWKGGRGCH